MGGRMWFAAAVALALFLAVPAGAVAVVALRGTGPGVEPKIFNVDTMPSSQEIVAEVRDNQQDLEEWPSPPAAPARNTHDLPSPSVGALKDHLAGLAEQIATLERQMQTRAAHGHTKEDLRIATLERSMEREQLVRLQREGEILKQLADRAARGHAHNASTNDVMRELADQRAVREQRQVELRRAVETNRSLTLRGATGSLEREHTHTELKSTVQQISGLKEQLAYQARAQAMKSDSIERALGQLTSQLHSSMRRVDAPSSPISQQVAGLRSQMKAVKDRINIAWQVASLKKEATSMQARVANLEQENHALRAYVEALGGMKAKKTVDSWEEKDNQNSWEEYEEEPLDDGEMEEREDEIEEQDAPQFSEEAQAEISHWKRKAKAAEEARAKKEAEAKRRAEIAAARPKPVKKKRKANSSDSDSDDGPVELAGGYYADDKVVATQDITVKGKKVVSKGDPGVVFGPAASDPDNRIAVVYAGVAGSFTLNVVPKEIRKQAQK